MTTLLRAATVVAVLTGVYCAASVWLVALPDTVPALAVCVVSILTAHYTYQLAIVPAAISDRSDSPTV